jgi:hypothetical protein
MDDFGRQSSMPGKRVQFDDETWQALDLLARDRMSTFQELSDEAFRDLLNKHGRPTDLTQALRQSVRLEETSQPASSLPPQKPKSRRSAPKRRSRTAQGRDRTTGA